MKTETLIAAYRQAALRHQSAIEQGRSRTATRAAQRIVELAQKIRLGGPEVKQAFLELLQDEHPAVRSWVAPYALEFAPEQAVPVLKELAAGTFGVPSLAAEVVLERWEAGTLDLP